MSAYRCPTCRKSVTVPNREQAPYRPFCSHRCQMIDLHHWFEGDYCISDPLICDPENTAPRFDEGDDVDEQ